MTSPTTKSPRHLRQVAIACLLALACTLPGRADAADRFDVRSWLDRAGVKLLVVEFYATWCKPCMDAVPRWEELRQRYHSKGLRLVVISTRDAEGCRSLAWHPDKHICDYEGNHERLLGVNGKLPAAFLWSWQGNLLVAHGKVKDVDAAVSRYLRSAPRVLIHATGLKGAADRGLRKLVEAEVGKRRKLTVVVAEKERRKLRGLQRTSASLRRRQDQQCKPGEEVSANTVLVAKRIKVGAEQRLFVGLQNISDATCQLGSLTVVWNKRRPAETVAEAIDGLFGQLRRNKVQMPRPGAAPSKVRERDLGSTGATWKAEETGGSVAIVEFVSEPPGAMVELNGNPICQKTPCSKPVAAGAHRVRMARLDHVTRSETVNLADGAKVRWKLEADYATVRFETTPPGLPVTVDGKAAGT